MQPFHLAIFFFFLPLVKPNICPDGSTCPGAQPCCLSTSGYRCCPYANGNCCPGGLSCCPLGYTCWGQSCVLLSKSNRQRTVEVLSTSSPIKESKLSQCPSGMTDCGSTPEGEERCPLPNAVCCSDGLHCCPNGYTCDLSEGLCIKNQDVQLMTKKIKNRQNSIGEAKLSQLSQCPSGMTDCGSTPEGEECCPLPNAVCCSDRLHCCPNGYTCDLSEGQCIKNQDVKLMMKRMKNRLISIGVAKQSQLSQCPSGMTDCGSTSQGEACCPLPNAVCCSDGLHCCPNGYTCDLSAGLCEQNQNVWAMVKKVKVRYD